MGKDNKLPYSFILASMRSSEKTSPPFNVIEITSYAVIWVAIFCIPFFVYRVQNTIEWGKVMGDWVRLLSFLIIFVLNSYLLVPRFLFQKKYLFYIGCTVMVILAVISINIFIRHFLTPEQPLYMPRMDYGPGMPPMELGSKMPAPMGFTPPEQPEQKSIYMIFADNLIIAILVVAAGTSVKMISKWLHEEGRRKDIEKEQLKTELALLRNQVSPHFFMNTLNNIHALVDINTEVAKNAIIRLSTLMRYLLYDTAKGKTNLKKEIEFIESYISLMELRYSNKVTISLDVPTHIPDVEIHPMLFVSFLENAFKHGVSYQSKSYVSCKLECNDEQLVFYIKNSKHKSNQDVDKSYSGIGLSNIRKSLDLLYNKDYILVINESNKEFEVQLTLPIYATKMFGN